MTRRERGCIISTYIYVNLVKQLHSFGGCILKKYHHRKIHNFLQTPQKKNCCVCWYYINKHDHELKKKKNQHYCYTHTFLSSGCPAVLGCASFFPSLPCHEWNPGSAGMRSVEVLRVKLWRGGEVAGGSHLRLCREEGRGEHAESPEGLNNENKAHLHCCCRRLLPSIAPT